MSQKRTFQIYRYDPDKDAKPYMQTIEIELDGNERMLLDALIKLKKVDPPCRSAAPAVKACAVRTR
jgi:succinate dehydrogenase / fumarate reductase iron-sulfur subunit